MTVAQLFPMMHSMAQITTPPEEPTFLTVKQTATRLSVSIWTVYDLVGDGSLRATKVGRNIKIKPEWVEEYVEGLSPYAPESA